MKLIRDKVAGLDVHRDAVVDCCRVPVAAQGRGQHDQAALPHDVEGTR